MVLMLSRYCHFNQAAYNEAVAVLANHGVKQNWITYDNPQCCNPGRGKFELYIYIYMLVLKECKFNCIFRFSVK